MGRRVAARFVAGETLEDAVEAARSLGRSDVAAMLDHLGENVTSPDQATAATAAYLEAVRRLHGADDVDGAISVKLTQLGLDVSSDLCLQNAVRLVDEAGEAGVLVMIDMEAHPYVDATLGIHAALRERTSRVGLCLQAALRRTPGDVASLPQESTVRLVKGAYLEPEDVAFPGRREVDASFARLFATEFFGCPNAVQPSGCILRMNRTGWPFGQASHKRPPSCRRHTSGRATAAPASSR